jgi:aminoglycoside phosphotransferase (APT) family kinase protein
MKDETHIKRITGAAESSLEREPLNAPEYANSLSFLPTSVRLLQGLRISLAEVLERKDVLDEGARIALQTADIVLNELLLRENRTFMTQLFAEMRDLASEGLALIEDSSDVLATDIAALPRFVGDSIAFDVAGSAIESVLSILSRQVDALRADPSESSLRFINRALDVETRLFTRPRIEPDVPPSTRNRITADSLGAYLSRRFKDRQYKILSFRELVEGFQKTTIFFVARDSLNREESMVVRAEKPDVFLRLDAGDVQSEFDIVSVVRDHGIPVAEPLWVEADPRELGCKFMVSRRLAGVNPGNPLSPQQLSEETARAIVHILARIHGTPLSDRIKASCIGHWLRYSNMHENTLASVHSWRNQLWMSRSNSSIATTRLYNWLVDNVPKNDGPVRLLHVDYGPHNILVDGDQVTGVVDWESVRIGDPAEDLSDLLSRFQGKIDRAKAVQWYRDAGGDEISEYRLRYFDAFNNMKTLVGPLSAAALYENEPQAPLRWCVLPLLYGSVSRNVEKKILAAEAVRGISGANKQ